MDDRDWKTVWNWKCALLSAVARSLIYAVALSRSGMRNSGASLAVIAVEMLYVTLTAGLYAGMQQKALGFRRRWLGDLTIVAGVPGLSQGVDWAVHRAAGAPVPPKALLSAIAFTLVSALFHRHVMRHGGFLTGEHGSSMADDLRRIPGLAIGFALWPGIVLRSLAQRLGRLLRTGDAGVAA